MARWVLWVVAVAVTTQWVAASYPTFQVLVTGFVPFGPYQSNPSELVAKRLDKQCVDVLDVPLIGPVTVCFASHVLPVNRTGSSYVSTMLSKYSPGTPGPVDAILHMGLEDFAKGLKVEVIGANVKAESSDPIVKEGPEVLPGTSNLHRVQLPELMVGLPGLVRSLGKVTEAWSRDAGTYYCNETYYRTLYELRMRSLTPRSCAKGLLPAVFVHLPSEKVASIEEDATFVTRLLAVMSATAFDC